MVAFHDRTIKFANNIQAFLRVGVVAYDVTHAGMMGAGLFLSIRQHRLKGVKVGMNVSENGESHES